MQLGGRLAIKHHVTDNLFFAAMGATVKFETVTCDYGLISGRDDYERNRYPLGRVRYGRDAERAGSWFEHHVATEWRSKRCGVAIAWRHSWRRHVCSASRVFIRKGAIHWE